MNSRLPRFNELQTYYHALEKLSSGKIRFALIGTFAFMLRGYLRDSYEIADCDLIIESDHSTINNAARILSACNWNLSIWSSPLQNFLLSADELKGKYYLRAKHCVSSLPEDQEISQYTIDLCYEHDSIDLLKILASAEPIEGINTALLSDLLALKRSAGRRRDFEFIESCGLSSFS